MTSSGEVVALVVAGGLGPHLVRGEVAGHLLQGYLLVGQFKIDHVSFSPGKDPVEW